MIALVAGCPLFHHDYPPCSVGDTALLTVDYDHVVDIEDGSMVPLVSAPQGGVIMLAGARIAGTTTCQLDATGALRDPTTQKIIGLDVRPLVVKPRGDGWLVPDPGLSDMPNIAVCPSAAATRSIDGNAYRLELSLQDSSGATLAQLAATVTPTCSDDGLCTSECQL